MGYSARYHAFSIIAVFFALAVGIAIGAGFGDNIIGGATKSLEDSLKQDVRDSRAKQDELAAKLGHEQDFGQQVYPEIVGSRLRGDTIGLISLGDLPDALANDVDSALGPAGARIERVAAVRLPASGRGSARPALLGRRLGEQFARGGPLLVGGRASLFDRFSGEPGPVDRVVLMRSVPAALEPSDQQAVDDYEAGILTGIESSGVPVVGVERTDADPSSVGFFDDARVSTVDDLDLVAGQVAMVFALLGAQGNFGVKDTADSLLPQLLLKRDSRAPSGTGGAKP